MKKSAPARRGFLAAAAVWTCAASGLSPALANEVFPAKPITLVVPYPPGGGTDGLGRVLAKFLGERLGQPVIVENVGGAGGTIGAAKVARAKADGYTLLLGTAATHSIAPELYRKMQYDAAKDFAPVANFAYLTNYIVAGPSLKVANVAELVALAKQKPDGVSFASAGNGTPAHLSIELFQQRAGVHLMHVPFKGGGPAVTDVMSGRVNGIFGDPVSVTPFLRAGKLRALAVAGPNRNPEFPNVPTAAEAGLPDFNVRVWHGVLAPAGVPPAILKTIADGVTAVSGQPEVLKLLRSMGAERADEVLSDFGKVISGERQKWGEVIRRGKVEVE